MSDQPPGKPSGDAPQPFTRGRIQWGRPPQTVFRVGPLPVGPTRPTPGPAPTTSPRETFFSGSMIPQGRPAQRPVEIETPFETLKEREPAPPPPVGAEAAAEPAFDDEDAYDGDEDAFEPDPPPQTSRTGRRDEIVVEPEEPDDLVTLPPLMSDAARPVADARAMPSVVVTPTLYARMGTAIESVAQPKNRWLIFAGVAAVIVTAAFIWIATLPAGEGGAPLDPDAPPPAAPGLADPPATTPETPPIAAEARLPQPPAPSVAPRADRTGPARQQARATPSTAIPEVQAPAPAPDIPTQTLTVPQPTPAEPPPSDPSAPIETRPQPLG